MQWEQAGLCNERAGGGISAIRGGLEYYRGRKDYDEP